MSWSRFNKTLVAGGVLVLIAAATVAFFFYDPRLKPGWEPVLWVLFLRDDASVYSPKYSEAAFDRVEPGMLKSDVLALLGEPLRKHPSGDPSGGEVWRYSEAPPDRNYWLRLVVFDTKGVVRSKDGHYFVD